MALFPIVETFPENVSHLDGVQVATIVDVADRAGVAITTVSRVINKKENVSVATRDRVTAAIEELNYRPSPAARSLPRGRVHTIAVVVPFVTHPSAVARVQGIVHGFRGTDIPVSIFDVEAPQHQAEHFSLLASSYRPEGAVIVSLLPTAAEIARFGDAGICPVFVDTEVDGFSSVTIDYYAGGRMATRHLIDLGHERIAFMGDIENLDIAINSSAERRRGYRTAMDEAGLDRPAEYELVGEHGRVAGRQMAEELLVMPLRPTAVFIASDTQAMGVMEAANGVGIRVPDELSVIGFDDVESAGYLGLTTVSQPLYESGLVAAHLVSEQLANPGCDPSRVELNLEVIVRSTTAPPSRWVES